MTVSLVVCKFNSKNDDALELITNAGYKGEAYRVPTEDGYLLKIHRVLPQNQMSSTKPPVFLMHGLIATAADFVMTGPKSALAYLLADNGYDVWMGNTRGSKHSMKHKTLSPDSREFWEFSWHEIGKFDVPAMIDFVLNKTNSLKAFYAGHSQGTTSLLVFLSTRPEYNEKIIQAHLLAPAGFMKNLPHPLAKAFNEEMVVRFFHEYMYFNFAGYWDVANEYTKVFCVEEQQATLALCHSLISSVAGPNRQEIEMDTVNTIELLSRQ